MITSPLQSVAKKDSLERRIVVDLSFPKGQSVNDGISKELYLGKPIDIRYPTLDDLTDQVVAMGRSCLLCKRDLKRAYRQLPVDPGEVNYLGYHWKDQIYVDAVLPMGLRSAAMPCQRVTNAIAYIMATKGFITINYLDDFGMAEKADRCNEGFQTLGNVLQELGFEESLEKAVAPITRMSFLGILIDTVSLTLEIPEEKLKEISLLVKIWLEKKSATRHQMESIIGKLKFVAQCVRPGRVFISRMLE